MAPSTRELPEPVRVPRQLLLFGDLAANRLGILRQWRWVTAYWFRLFAAGVFGTGAAFAASFVIPQTFSVELRLTPANAEPVDISGNLLAIASRFGVQPRGQGSSLDYYALVIQSDTVIRQLLESRFAGGVLVHNPAAGRPLISEYAGSRTPPERRYAIATGKLRKHLRISSDIVSGTIRIRFDAYNRYQALGVARALVDVTNGYLKVLNSDQYRTERVYLEERLETTRNALTALEDSLRAFYDANRTFESSAELRTEEGRLRRRLQLQEQEYMGVAQQLAGARAEEARNTPVLSLANPGVLPAPMGNRQRLLISAVVGLGLATLVASALMFHSFLERRPVHT